MPSKKYFSYVRVSTQRQGQSGTSLAEQNYAIDSFAERWGLNIVKRFEERETAAKTGRPVFLEMLKSLKKGEAHGLIVHKIDRSARNLRDWADLGALMDTGIEVHFANESLDMGTRGGRLSADIQAVVAADYIRNLREETKKGIYGRLKQGLYPFPARVGYLDRGKGEPKALDPIQAPLIRKAFELYASGQYGLNALVEKMYELGLRNKSGGRIVRNGLVSILKNPFYTGLIKIDKTNEVFAGRHTPIVSRELFGQVQDVFAGRRIKKQLKHFFVFRRFVICKSCQNLLIPERQKGFVYYRCQTKRCIQKTVREEIIENKYLQFLQRLQMDEDEMIYLNQELDELKKSKPQNIALQKENLKLRIANIEDRIERLADGYMDQVFDRESYMKKKNELIAEKHNLEVELTQTTENLSEIFEEIDNVLELSNSAYSSWKLYDGHEKREMVEITTSNFTAYEKTVSIKLKTPYDLIAERPRFPVGSPRRATSRTWRQLAKNLFQYARIIVMLKRLAGIENNPTRKYKNTTWLKNFRKSSNH